jgi:hypothetical protein
MPTKFNKDGSGVIIINDFTGGINTSLHPLFIKDNEATIKEFLSKHNITYKKNYRHLLHNYAELNHMRIVYTL